MTDPRRGERRSDGRRVGGPGAVERPVSEAVGVDVRRTFADGPATREQELERESDDADGERSTSDGSVEGSTSEEELEAAQSGGPVERSTAEPEADRAAREDDGDATVADVLLVEDNPGDVRLTQEAFEAGPVENELHVVTDGNEALEFLNGRGVHADAPDPDLVLLDLNLPRKNGDEVLEAVSDDPELAPTPVVVLTSSNAEEDVERSYELRANAFLTKPVDPEEFIDVVQAVQEFWLSVVRLPPGEDGD